MKSANYDTYCIQYDRCGQQMSSLFCIVDLLLRTLMGQELNLGQQQCYLCGFSDIGECGDCQCVVTVMMNTDCYTAQGDLWLQ